MVCGVIPKLNPWKEGMPFTRLLMSKAAEILFKSTIDDLHLAISLRVVSGTHFQLGARNFEELFPEIADEYGTVTNDGPRHAMQLHHPVDKFFSLPLCCIWMGNNPKVY